jgi:hypothetical protein
MIGFGTSELIILGIIATFIAKRRLSALLHQIQEYTESLQQHFREPNMTERFKKFLWSPKFCVLLGIVGCTTGLYFQGVAANGSGLWCLGLIFLGVAYLDKDI